VAESWLLPVDFPAYLEAKVEIDDESLSPRLLGQVRRRVRRLRAPRLLDVGTGTGAMLRRLLRLLPPPLDERPLLVGLDVERSSLEVAAAGLRADLAARGLSVREVAGPDGISISGPDRSGLRIDLVAGGLLDPGLPDRLEGGGFDLVSAHAVLDLLPLEEALRVIRRLLRPGGTLYATLNYDGLTTLIPPYGDPDLEARLLERYERSMEERREDGRATGGRFSGRRLCGSLPEEGYAILAAGSSDWAVFPGVHGHPESRRLFLRSLLTFMAREAMGGAALQDAALTGVAAGRVAPAGAKLPPEEVEPWYRDRLQAVENGTLSLVAHQLDVLAEVRP